MNLENDIMIDIETLGTGPDAHILSIGACNMQGTKRFHKKLTLTPQNRNIDVETVAWWMKQSEAARSDLFDGGTANRTNLHSALIALHAWLKDANLQNVWSHGATFDIVILENALRQHSLSIPWNYYNARDTRTLIDLVKTKYDDDCKPVRKGIHHSAVDDALFQAEWMRAIMEKIR